MIKKSLFVGGIGLSLIVAWTVIFDDSIEDENIPIQSDFANANHKKEDVLIVYDNEESSQEADKKEDKKLVVREKYVEANTFDKSGTYEIALINPDQEEGKIPNKYIRIDGTIDDNKFYLDVPQFLSQADTSKVLLRIKNIKTDEVQSVEASFLDLLDQDNQRHFMKINSKNIDNIDYQIAPSVLP